MGNCYTCLTRVITALLIATLCACSGGSGSGKDATAKADFQPAPAPAEQISDIAASRFLEQATFGPTPNDIAHLQAVGYDTWFNEQFSAPLTDYPAVTDDNSLDVVQAAFFKNALSAPDQLRQRVAFALGQIFVVSDEKIDSRIGIVNFQRTLLSDTFGNYRQLLRDVTLSPAMGTYLDMVNNTRADPLLGTSPNENYAREIMQLFSLGLDKLNPDGTAMHDANGKTIPTYGQDQIKGMARTFTGWIYPAKPDTASQSFNDPNFVGEMIAQEDFHEPGTKQLLDTVQPAGQGAVKDLDAAIDSIFRHDNIGPFVGLRLIQALVKSNPSPAYVQRVSAIFNNNGNGVRGDMKALLRAVLLDAEARAGDRFVATASDGKLREPVLYVTRLLRAFKTASDGVDINYYSQSMRQDVFNAPSVFNFYPPSYKPQGYTLAGPEFKILDAPAISARMSFLFDLTNQGLPANTKPDFSGLIAAANDVNGLVAYLDARLMHGATPASLRNAVTASLAAAGDDNQQRAMLALYLFAASPAFNIQR